MRQYPRSVKLPDKPESAIHVNNEMEEYEASLEGYESHWNPEIIKKRKGTDREILKVKPVTDEIPIIKEESAPLPPDTGILEDVIPGIEDKPLTRGQKAAATRKRNREAKNG
jgi:hypothetical protein